LHHMLLIPEPDFFLKQREEPEMPNDSFYYPRRSCPIVRLMCWLLGLSQCTRIEFECSVTPAITHIDSVERTRHTIFNN
jgi:hypothetical protein